MGTLPGEEVGELRAVMRDIDDGQLDTGSLWSIAPGDCRGCWAEVYGVWCIPSLICEWLAPCNGEERSPAGEYPSKGDLGRCPLMVDGGGIWLCKCCRCTAEWGCATWCLVTCGDMVVVVTADCRMPFNKHDNYMQQYKRYKRQRATEIIKLTISVVTENIFLSLQRKNRKKKKNGTNNNTKINDSMPYLNN